MRDSITASQRVAAAACAVDVAAAGKGLSAVAAAAAAFGGLEAKPGFCAMQSRGCRVSIHGMHGLHRLHAASSACPFDRTFEMVF